jgi:hypothetical protein
MSKPTTRYVITPSEWADACTYLQRKFALHAEWIDNPDAPRSFREHARDPATLSHWCQH